MSYRVQLVVQDDQEKEKIETWLAHPSFSNLIVQNEGSILPDDILIVEITSLFDWVKVRRMMKQYQDILIIPILDQSMTKTSPIAIELGLPSLLIKPLKSRSFYRNFKKAFSLRTEIPIIEETVEGESYRDMIWRRVLKGDITSEVEMSESLTLLPSAMVPNLVCCIQGFLISPEREKKEGWEASSVVQKVILKAFSAIGYEAYFVPFHKNAALLLKVPSDVATPSFWAEGEQVMFSAIEVLREEYGIQLYIGVGSICREVMQLKSSYANAKVARMSVAKHELWLRYFDEIPTNVSVQKSIDYIRSHYAENISMNKVAAKVNFSPTYFSRLFKKETGHSFVSYVTLVKLQRSIWLLRRTNQTIEEIAMELGFNTPNYFSATFKKEIGWSPSQYRGTKEILFSHSWVEDDF
ncbi:helix-turn-helix transcriptional regulator [Peribacillus asahii]|uniref:Transcriptional regulator, AraC family n=1 Tax=Peribacillus asahii TaxID=228899 RepID=A0A3Q9RR81_9BACI|nr:AraC family transcriptional regulator [Peribacillus asahii]AZV44797.1 transcriptional regulator, AraC family [Peribacillus asahii]USK84448.1 AraC family transcriptional regulator [Peribacillus asahii]